MIQRLFVAGLLFGFTLCVATEVDVCAQEARTVGLAALASRDVAGAETFDAAWTIIRDTHFDPRMNGLDWNAVKAELRPRAAAAKDAGELRAVIREMLGRLGQSHFTIIPGSGDSPLKTIADLSGDPGIDVRLVGDAMVVTGVEPQSAAQTAGALCGVLDLTVEERFATDRIAPLAARNLPPSAL